jgi:hypothetical protein
VDFLKLHPEVVLLRWLNYHLEKAGSARYIGVVIVYLQYNCVFYCDTYIHTYTHTGE